MEGKIDELRILEYGINKVRKPFILKFDVSKLRLHPAIIDQICHDSGVRTHRIIKDGRPTIDYIY